jgi:phosphoesterase RecJ-like protein
MTIDETASYLTTLDDIIIASHEAPDADGLGAQYALTKGLRSIGKRVRAINADHYAPKYHFIDVDSIVEAMDEAALDQKDLARSTILLVDTNDVMYTGQMYDIAVKKAKDLFFFDHHEAKSVPVTAGCILPALSSTSEMAYLLLTRMGIDISTDMANALYAGIVYDTGSFAYDRTSASTFEAALALVRRGASPTGIHTALYESTSINVLMLKKAVLATLELHHNATVAIQTMTTRTLTETGSAYEDAEDLINLPLQVQLIEVSILFKENMQGVLRCSLRSKGRVNVAQLAQSFGGGGHRRAAGFKSPCPLDTIKAKVLDILASTQY